MHVGWLMIIQEKLDSFVKLFCSYSNPQQSLEDSVGQFDSGQFVVNSDPNWINWLSWVENSPGTIIAKNICLFQIPKAGSMVCVLVANQHSQV